MNPSPTRAAVAAELARTGLTVYALHRLTREIITPAPTQSAIHEWLRGQRAIGSDHLDAILTALGLVVRRG